MQIWDFVADTTSEKCPIQGDGMRVRENTEYSVVHGGTSDAVNRSLCQCSVDPTGRLLYFVATHAVKGDLSAPFSLQSYRAILILFSTVSSRH